MDCGTMMNGMGMMMWLGLGLGLLLIVFMVLAGIAIARWLRGTKPQENALDILKKRFAKGEIGKDEYERMKKDIK